MKTIILTLALGTLILVSCNNYRSFITGSWTIDNLSSTDTSANSETLLTTALVSHYADKNILIFSWDNSVTMTTADGKELDKGEFKLTDSDTHLKIKFLNDKMESNYQIADKTDKAMKLTAIDRGETVTILLTKSEK